jgi:TPR repeat protein
MLLGGRGMPKDEARAVQLFERACDGGSVMGCRALGLLYTDGSGGLTADAARARQLFERGCALGDQLSCERLDRPAPRP